MDMLMTEFLKHLFVKSGNVVGFSASDETAINHHRAIRPFSAGVGQIRL
jgi:hypothetical protein